MQLKQEIRVLPVRVLRDVRPGDKRYSLILRSLVHNKIILEDGDIVVIAQKIVSKAEGQIVRLSSLIFSCYSIGEAIQERSSNY